MKTPDRQILSNLSKNTSAQYISIYSDNSTKRKLFSKHEEIKWDKENHTFFLKIGEGMMQKWRLRCVTQSVWVRFSWERNGEDSEQSQKFEGKLKNGLKTDPVFAKHAIFATEVSRKQVAKSSRQNTQRQDCEKFSKCFSRLEGLPARESRVEPRKS